MKEVESVCGEDEVPSWCLRDRAGKGGEDGVVCANTIGQSTTQRRAHCALTLKCTKRAPRTDSANGSRFWCAGEPTAISQPQSVDYCSWVLRPFPTNGTTIAPYSTWNLVPRARDLRVTIPGLPPIISASVFNSKHAFIIFESIYNFARVDRMADRSNLATPRGMAQNA